MSDDRAAEEGPALTMVGAGDREAKAPVVRKATQQVPVKLAAPAKPVKKKRSWMFWRGPSKRSMELEEVRKGCEKIEQVVGVIRDQLETAGQDRAVLNKTLSPLPLAVDGLRRVGETQEQTNVMLQRVGASLERSEEKDKVFFKSMDRMGDTMSNMDMAVVGMGRTFSSMERTSKQSVDTMQRLSERLTESDRFLKETFQRLRDAEHQYGEYMRTNSRRSALVTISLCALMTLGIAVLAHTLGGASHNVMVLGSPVPAALPHKTTPAPDPVPADWQAQPTEKWMGVAGDWPVEESSAAASPVDDLSNLPTSLEIPERLEDLLSINKEIAD